MSENIAYLNLLERKLDNQQIAACCSEGNTVVAAGAGSGKTQVLATRFAYLVMTKNVQADRILTLTFTKKAASEMYERIHDTLEFFASNEKTPPAEKKRAEDALKIFSRAHIQTLDSYCSAILRQCASRYGISPDFSQADSTDVVSGLAFPFILKHRNEQVVHDYVNFSNGGDLQVIADEFAYDITSRTSLASKDSYFTDFLLGKVSGIKKLWKEQIEKLYSQIDDFYSAFDILEKVSDGSQSLRYEIERLSEMLDSFASLELFGDGKNCSDSQDRQFSEIYDNLNSIKFVLPRDKASEPVKDIIRIIRGDESSDVPLLKLKECACFMKDFSMWMRRAELQNVFLKEVNRLKRTSGSLSFRDISVMALEALKDFDDIRHQEQNAYDKIMIDEFQDNNKSNRDLLFLISCPNETSAADCLSGENVLPDKLFFVGDDKQSIYKFRDADVSVFKKLSEDLKTTPIPMVYNYRSTQELLNSFNQIFGGFNPDKSEVSETEKYIFPHKAESDFEAEFTEKTIAEKNPDVKTEPNPFKNPSVHVCMYNKDLIEGDEELSEIVNRTIKEQNEQGNNVSFSDAAKIVFMDVKDQKAIFMAQEIKRRIAESRRLVEEGKLKKPLSYSDFAILDKGRGDRNYYTKYLLAEGIPFNLDQQNDLFGEASVNDIYYLLRLCVYPSDTFALSVFLHSPFVCLSEQSVENILGDLENIREKGEDIVQEGIISKDEYERFKSGMTFFEDLKSRVFREPLSKIITELWYKYGYRYETLWHKNLYLSAESYDILFEIARKSDEAGQTVSDFIDSLDNLRESAKDENIDLGELSYPKESADEVQIMTIHKSKGLQFPFVFVYGCTGSFRKDKDDRDEKQTEESPFGESKEIDDAKSEAEFRRLIYVALTRAEKEVYVVGNWYHPDSSIFQIITNGYYPDAMSAKMTGEPIFVEGAPFDFISIKPADRDSLSKNTPDENAKIDFVCNLGKQFQNVNVIKTEELCRNVVSPSSLELPAEECRDSKVEADELYPNLTPLLKKLEMMNFNPNDFGTLAHAFMESYVKKSEKPVRTPALYKSLYNYDISFEENMKKSEIKEMRDVCGDMILRFEKSDFGSELKDAVKIKAEQGFIASIDGQTVNGVIDLAYQKPDGSVVIVDYKTDEEILPKRYYAQIACYKDAVSSLFGVDRSKITCWLYYLRYAKGVKI